ncbi:adenylosuccinate synthase [Alienimonas californiensis]|uniref:Adenylosuccinate synthetase n=1 Tax=Alienimonas californiensis TaxID=2527989 RepID=A0A517PF62_9PLAN|nr:adenylosuccinate synthase [Alienimonas californiensis]QDT18010.1 Adenylosuccinate synthetase [Alienimonas californiensis]
MPATSVIGLQWGDEAKGKFVDVLTDQHDVVCRYLGGNNAGHTVVFDGKTFKLSLLPAGVLHPGKTAVIATGVVLDPAALLNEMDRAVQSMGGPVPPEGTDLLISDRAHLIFPWHLAEDAALETDRGDAGQEKIGTTLRGIGPCYRDKAGRTHAVRAGDLLRPDRFRQRVAEVCAFKNRLLGAMIASSGQGEFTPFDADEIADRYLGFAERLGPFITDTTAFLLDAADSGKNILFEAAQGSMLDLDHGTFPYVTSSNSSGCGVHPGSGVPERHLDTMLGVVKAYSTRVGGGPFVTELDNEIGERIRTRGNEFGTVTGRPRRCGWFDAVAARYAARVSGVDALAVSLLDVLDGFDELQICEAYELNGRRTTDFPSHADDLAEATPIYRTLPGWSEDTTSCRTYGDLPANARTYLETLAELLGTKLTYVGVGPDREQTIRV